MLASSMSDPSGTGPADLGFDAFTRYWLGARIAEGLTENLVRPRILDVGGRGGSLAAFFGAAAVTVMDARPPEAEADRRLEAEGRYVVGDVTKEAIPGARYDIVVSMDMLEHVSPDRRPEVLRNILNASRIGAVIGFPADSPEANCVEETANERYRDLFGEDHPWLLEHFACRPLPSTAEVDSFLEAEGYAFRRFNGNNVFLWLLMMEFLFLAWRRGIPTGTVEAIYREEFLAGRLGDAVEPAYRTIYAIVPASGGAGRLERLSVDTDDGGCGSPGRWKLQEGITAAVHAGLGVSGGPGGPTSLDATRLAVRLCDARSELERSRDSRRLLESEVRSLEMRLAVSGAELESLGRRLGERERYVEAIHASAAWRLVQAVRGLLGLR